MNLNPDGVLALLEKHEKEILELQKLLEKEKSSNRRELIFIADLLQKIENRIEKLEL